ncbi:arginine--tRNA ligase, cytoplasmic [Elysia marginata]|uniref:arginine--tRNA ligase n=1 Tax=Elysia marginata TaxID=1093978 RepID=A0AAV4GDZ1_9GAST|nr:arginine--tRNA ligase, cytoplasmic [Elysia marginata]
MASDSEEQSKQYALKAEKAEKEIERLQAEINLLSDPAQLQKEGLASPELEKLRGENQKLTFQLKHLKKNLENEQARGRDFALDVRGIIEDIFGLAIYSAFPEVPNPTILVMPSSKFADYQCNSAMSIAQQLGTITGQKKNPREVAQAIVKELPESEFFEKIEIAGPGFINITLKKEFVLKEIGFLLTQGVKPPKLDKKRVVIDYSSPNIAKEMHVGHLRSTIIGESMSRLLEWVGHDVLRLNHLGDWGTQFGMLIAHLIDKFPNLLKERPNIGDLQEFYRESKVRFDNDEVFKRRAYECVVKLQAKDPFYYSAWKIIYDISMKETYRLYKRLQVSDKLVERGESFYQERMVSLVKDLQESGRTELDEEGRRVMYVEGFTVPLMIVKSDGGFTYDTSDLACIKQRLQEEKADWIIYVVDAGQSTHLETVFKAAAQLGWTDKSKHRIDHVAFGLVLGEDK